MPKKPAAAKPDAAPQAPANRSMMIRVQVLVPAVILAGVALIIWLLLPRQPDPVACLQTAMAQNTTIDKSGVVELAELTKSGKINLNTGDKESVSYRAVTDETVRLAITFCREKYVQGDRTSFSCAGGVKAPTPDPVKIVSAPTLVTVMRTVGDRKFPVSGVTVHGKADVESCKTDDDKGQCLLLLRDHGLDEKITIVATLPAGNVEKEGVVGDFVKQGVNIAAPSEFTVLRVSVSNCQARLMDHTKVGFDAAGAILWGYDCGAKPPQAPGECREQYARQGEALFRYDPATFASMKSITAVLTPDNGARETTEVTLPLHETLNLQYPTRCSPNGAGATPTGPASTGPTRCSPSIEARLRNALSTSGATGSVEATVATDGTVSGNKGPEPALRQLKVQSFGKQPAECVAKFSLP
jgi:hypothetical protein